jgi:hypothetical protein
MVPIKMVWERAGKGVDWLIRGQFIVQVLISLGIGKIVQWLVTKYAQVSPALAAAIWLIASGIALWLLLIILRRKVFVQESGLEAITTTAPQGIEANIKAVTDFYKTGSGPFLDEIEAHFQRLAAHHQHNADREQFLIKALSGGAVSYLHDMSWASIFKSQIDALHELNTRGAMTADGLKPFYDAAAAAHREVYKNYTFDGWLKYLVEQTLIRRDGQVIQITIRGKDFLKYIVQACKPMKIKQF